MAILKNILTINCGSSSLKASLFRADGQRRNFHYAHLDDDTSHGIRLALDQLLNALGTDLPAAVVHRFVHGGEIHEAARIVDSIEEQRLSQLIPLAPLHLPNNLLGVDLCRKLFNVPQIACFDTAFHATMPEISKRLPIPRSLGLHKFGFHGINYAYIAKMLPGIIGETAYRNVIVAHLGSGASLCLMQHLQSVDTTMGYTPAGGIAMGTRSGDIDPGVMLALAKQYPIDQLADMMYHQMGLLALSDGESADMKKLLTSQTPAAQFAVNYFCRQVSGAIGSMAAKAGGIDALVFTAGIGEHAAEVRQKICAPLNFLGLSLDSQLNQGLQINQDMTFTQLHARNIAQKDSKPILIIPADEEIMMRDLSISLIPDAIPAATH